MRPIALLVAAIALAALPGPAGAWDELTGLEVSASLAGGAAASGSRAQATSGGGIVEGELGAGVQVGQGFRPELSLFAGLAPAALLGARPGLSWGFPGTPFSLRGALDFAAPRGSWRLRWLLAGGGGELRLTDQIGAFAEADLGIPLAGGAGLALLVRVGVRLRL